MCPLLQILVKLEKTRMAATSPLLAELWKFLVNIQLKAGWKVIYWAAIIVYMREYGYYEPKPTRWRYDFSGSCGGVLSST